MKYTPGPWGFNAAGCLTSHGLPTINKSNGHLLASLADTNAANAKLIAAAPDLLEALQETLDSLTQNLLLAHGNTASYIEQHPAVASARAAIAKATGAAA